MSYTKYPGSRGLGGRIYRHPYTTCPCAGCSVGTGPAYFIYYCPDGSVIGPVYQTKKKKTRKSKPIVKANFGWRKGKRSRRKRR